MKSMTDILLWVVGLLAFGFGLWQFMLFLGARDEKGIPHIWAGTDHLWTAIFAIVVASICGVMIFVRRPHVEEEIHITK